MATKEPDAVSRKRMGGEADIRGPSIQARLRLESEEVEKSALIREWQDKTVEQPSVGSGGVISRLFNGCVSLLRSILKCSKGKDRLNGDYTQLQESLLALILWSEDHHLSTGNLDTQLHDFEDLRDLICSLLLSLADLLVNGLLQHIVTSPAERHATLLKYNMMSLVHEARKEVSIVETPVDYTRDDVPSMAATLGTLVDCLIALNSAKDDSKDQPGYFTVIEDRPPYHYHMELIESKYPNASRPLLERLGKCNWERYLRLQERREMIKDGESLQGEEIESKSRFNDSALGTSVPAQSESGSSIPTYTETVVSSRAASSHHKLPKLPREGRNGQRFICQVCNRIVAIRYSRDWKKHVFQDLLAYNCIYEGCLISSISLWEDRDAMTNHLAVEHGLDPEWKSHPCPLCTHHTGEGKDLISLHISRHMEEIALNALPRGYESDSESEADSAITASDSTSSQDDDSLLPSTTSKSLPRPEDEKVESSTLIPHEPSQYSTPTAPHSSVDSVPNDQRNFKSPVPGIASISSPNANSSDWDSPYQDQQSANVSANSLFLGSSDSTYLPPISSTVSPGTLPSTVKGKPELYDEEEINPFRMNYSDQTNIDNPVMQPHGAQIQTSHFPSISYQPSLPKPPIAEGDSCLPGISHQRPDVLAESSVQGLASPREPQGRRMPLSPAFPPRRNRRRRTSMPGTPTFSKAVHFNDDIEQVRHFLQVDRPIAVSTGSSTMEKYDSEYEDKGGDEADQEQGEKQEDDNDTGHPEGNENADGDLAPLTLGSPAIDKLQQQRRDQVGLGDERQHQVVDGDGDDGTGDFEDDSEAEMAQTLANAAKEGVHEASDGSGTDGSDVSIGEDIAASRSEARREALPAKQRNRNHYVDSEFEDSRRVKQPPTNRGKKVAQPPTEEAPTHSTQSVASFDPAHPHSVAAMTPREEQDAPPASSSSPFPGRDAIPKKNARFEIPPERSLHNIDQLIAESTNEEEIKELKQQKHLLLNRQAALDARNRKESHDQLSHESTQERTGHMSVADTLRTENELRKMGEEITSDGRASEITHHGHRRKVADVLTAFGDYFSNTPHEPFDESEFRSENASQYPEVPGELAHNETLDWERDANDSAPSIRGRHSRAASVSGSETELL